MPELEAQSPVTREQAVEAAKRMKAELFAMAKEKYPEHTEELFETSWSNFCTDEGIICAKYILQSPPIAAWDADKWIFDLLVEVRQMDEEYPYDELPGTFESNERAWKRWRARKAAELSSMPGGRVCEQTANEVRSAIESIETNSNALWQEPQECVKVLMEFAKSILSGRGADDSVEAVTREWLGGDHATYEGNGNKVYIYVGYTSGGDDEGNGRWCACINDSPFGHSVRVPTRGHVRRLCAALGIELNQEGK